MQAVKAAKDENLFDAFKAVEDNKWFGQLRGKGMTFSFRHGVCQSFTKTMDAYGYEFEMNIINDAVDFRKEKV
jgi:hypothetical protein